MKPYRTIQIDTATPNNPESSILIIYTGGTLGMVTNEIGALVPFEFESILEYIPSLRTFDLHITVIAFEEPIDSSNIRPSHWAMMGDIISVHYLSYDGFLILHGTDTMAYSASALSFMLQGLSKPVILTGAQLPVSSPRTDARENIITALEIATAKNSNRLPIIQEVCVCFGNLLLRGNRCRKVESQQFDAFESENCPPLAEAGINIEYNMPIINQYRSGNKFTYRRSCNTDVAILKIFPGISKYQIAATLQIPYLKGVILESYGSGNALTDKWFVELLENSINSGVAIVNVSQCTGGRVVQGKYATSTHMDRIGVIEGRDMTSEAALTKLMILLSDKNLDSKGLKKMMQISIAGELS